MSLYCSYMFLHHGEIPMFEKPYIYIYVCVCDISQLQRQSILPYSLLYVVIIFVEIGTSKKYGRS